MEMRRIFSLSDVIAIVVCVVLVVAVVIPFVSPRGRRPHRPMQNGTQVRAIHQSLVLYSNANNGYYPGYTSDGSDDFAAISASVTDFGANALTDDDLGKVYAILLTGEYFYPDYIISPSDSIVPVTYDPKSSAVKPTIDNTMYSYALLDKNDSPSERRIQWKNANGWQAPIVADPSSDIRPLPFVTYHSEVPAPGNSDFDYEGSIAWNDNHMTFENTGLFRPGTLKLGETANATPVNPFKATGADDVKFIW